MQAAAVGPARQCVELARKDLQIEWRAGESLLVTASFGAIALMFVPLAVGSDVPLLRQLGPGLYWLIVLLFGALVTLRQSAIDGPAQRAALQLCGVRPTTLLAARSAANAVLLVAFELLLAPVAVVLYDPDLTGWVWLVPAIGLVAIGLAILGTLADALARGLAVRSALGPVLVLPVSLPLLLGATQLLEAARQGHRPWSWLLLMFTVDLAAAVTIGLAARHLEDVR